MARPRRNPDAAAERITIYVTPAVRERLLGLAAQAGVSAGAYIDVLLGSQPHPGAPVAVGRREHPGWRTNSMNINVCIACGGMKTRVRDQPCPGGES